MNLTPLPALADNYIWVLENAGETWVVDPGDSRPVRDYLDTHQSALSGILITHHHRDHIGGVEALLEKGMRVIGPARSALPYTTEKIQGGEQVRVAGSTLQALAIPGHTLNHIAFYAKPPGTTPLLLCGDTLFVAGCGRLFEGTPSQMYQSLQRLANLPEDTRIYCAHEYTLANLHFAEQVEPDNPNIARSKQKARELRDRELPTVPSTLAQEKLINPFLRAHLPTIKSSIARQFGEPPTSDVECFAYLRQWKDSF